MTTSQLTVAVVMSDSLWHPRGIHYLIVSLVSFLGAFQDHRMCYVSQPKATLYNLVFYEECTGKYKHGIPKCVSSREGGLIPWKFKFKFSFLLALVP